MTRHILSALALGLTFATPAAALDLNEMSVSETDAFGAQVRAYLLENPEVIFEAVAVLEQRQEQLAAANDTDLLDTHADAIFNDPQSWVGGNPEGDITIVEFMDYRCGYCRKAFPEVSELIASDGNIRLIVKELPILGEGSVLASRFAIATLQVLGADAYEAVHDALMVYNGEVAEPGLRRLAEALDLDTDAIMAAMDSDDVTAVITANRALAGQLDISGTPSFVMHNQMLRGYVPLEGMQQIVASIRAE
ncbi:DsbA family protein [Rhodobacteraceae bacterium KMM 6894]|nr:DsbA family protein [Rhodobacteraceae bacterium KMM 6894]